MPASWGIRRWSVLGALALGGCIASQGGSPGAGTENAASSVPLIHLNLLGAGASTNYVDAGFQVSEDAYVMIVAVDLDRRVRVVFPEAPDESGYVTAHSSKRITRFFAGFGPISRRYANFSLATQPITRNGGGGILLAIASNRPLQLGGLADGEGDFNEESIARLVFNASAPSAAYSLGRAVTRSGQQFNTDYSSFGGGLGGHGTFASNSFSECGGLAGFGYDGFADSYSNGSLANGDAPFVIYFRSNGVLYAQYLNGGRCGRASYSAPIPVQGAPRIPMDTTHRDSVTSPYRGRIADRLDARRSSLTSNETVAPQARTARPTSSFRVPSTPASAPRQPTPAPRIERVRVEAQSTTPVRSTPPKAEPNH
jgi:hypothetical protein